MILLTHLGGDISIIEGILALIFKIIMMVNAMDFFDLNKKTYAILWISYNCQML